MSATRRAVSLCALLGVFVVGCGPAPATMDLPVGDDAFFRERVSPHLESRCASAGCHGRPERPLSLYARGQHRADPSRAFLDEPLSDEELTENARRVAAFALGRSARDSLAVQKPLAIAAGGVAHGGGDVFLDASDEGCRALIAWLDGRAVDGGAP